MTDCELLRDGLETARDALNDCVDVSRLEQRDDVCERLYRALAEVDGALAAC